MHLLSVFSPCFNQLFLSFQSCFNREDWLRERILALAQINRTEYIVLEMTAVQLGGWIQWGLASKRW